MKLIDFIDDCSAEVRSIAGSFGVRFGGGQQEDPESRSAAGQGVAGVGQGVSKGVGQGVVGSTDRGTGPGRG